MRTASFLCLFLYLTGCGKHSDRPLAAEAHPGRIDFQSYCSACHHPDGTGMEGGAPPLLASPWVAGPEDRLIRIVLHGLRGPIRVGDRVYELEMPGFGPVLDDARVAAVLSFVRARFAPSSAPITPQAVGRIRAAHPDRMAYWTVDELLQTP